MTILLLSCGDDDKTTNNDSVEIYAQLSLTRFYPSQGGLLVVLDSIFASYDTAYSPISPIKPCQTINVKCDDYQLEWDQNLSKHFYSNDSFDIGFLEYGHTYIFNTADSQEVPPFEKSIRFPTVQPTIIYPRYINFMTGPDTVLLSNPLTITWNGTGIGDIELIICDDSINGYRPADTLIHAITENDGSFTIGTIDLGVLTPNKGYKLLLIVKNQEAITVQGYDSRSYIMAQNYTFSNFYVE